MTETRTVYSTSGDKRTDDLCDLIGAARVEMLCRMLALMIYIGHGTLIISVKDGRVIRINPRRRPPEEEK